MSKIKSVQSWRFEFTYGYEHEGEEDGGEHYGMTECIDVSKTADGKPVKIFSQHDTGKYINHLFWWIEKGKLEDLKKLLETKGDTKSDNSMYDPSIRYPDTDIDVEVDNVFHAFASGSSML